MDENQKPETLTARGPGLTPHGTDADACMMRFGRALHGHMWTLLKRIRRIYLSVHDNILARGQDFCEELGLNYIPEETHEGQHLLGALNSLNLAADLDTRWDKKVYDARMELRFLPGTVGVPGWRVDTWFEQMAQAWIGGDTGVETLLLGDIEKEVPGLLVDHGLWMLPAKQNAPRQ